jgi:excisionase family DNA binding protein
MPTQSRRGHPAKNPPDLMTVAEAARRLCVSGQTVRDWFHAGRIKGVRIGHQIRLFSDAVLSLLNPSNPVKE